MSSVIKLSLQICTQELRSNCASDLYLNKSCVFPCLSNAFTAPLLLPEHPCQSADGRLVCGTRSEVLVTADDAVSLLVAVGAIDAVVTKLFEEDL